jgi:hypothetical protein
MHVTTIIIIFRRLLARRPFSAIIIIRAWCAILYYSAHKERVNLKSDDEGISSSVYIRRHQTLSFPVKVVPHKRRFTYIHHIPSSRSYSSIAADTHAEIIISYNNNIIHIYIYTRAHSDGVPSRNAVQETDHRAVCDIVIISSNPPRGRGGKRRRSGNFHAHAYIYIHIHVVR